MMNVKSILVGLLIFATNSAFAQAERAISCGYPFYSASVSFLPLGFADEATIWWGYEKIVIQGCQQVDENQILCESTRKGTEPGQQVNERLTVEMNADGVGSASFRRTYIPDPMNISSNIQINDCKYITK